MLVNNNDSLWWFCLFFRTTYIATYTSRRTHHRIAWTYRLRLQIPVNVRLSSYARTLTGICLQLLGLHVVVSPRALLGQPSWWSWSPLLFWHFHGYVGRAYRTVWCYRQRHHPKSRRGGRYRLMVGLELCEFRSFLSFSREEESCTIRCTFLEKQRRWSCKTFHWRWFGQVLTTEWLPRPCRECGFWNCELPHMVIVVMLN